MMDCSCIKDIYDFNIESRNCCKTIYYQDLSLWMDATYDEYYTKPSEYEIIIKKPSGTELRQNVSTEGFTLLNNINCDDGIYCFSVYNCDGVKLTRNRLLAFDLESKIDCLRSQKEDYSEQMWLAERFLNDAKIQAERKKELRARELYLKAAELISRYDCKCSC